MKRIYSPILATLALLACTGCGNGVSLATLNTPRDLQEIQQGAASTKPSSQSTSASNATITQGGALTGYASAGQDCSSRAQSRLTMYDRPDTYPISEQERHDAYLALYSSCMREHDYQIAGPVRGPGNDASAFANLSPAAGGNYPARANANTVTAGNTLVSTSTIPGGATVVVVGGNNQNLASQLSSLSPSSGGSPQPTVVMVSAQQNPGAVPMMQGGYYAPAQPLPVAVPIPPPPMAKAYQPAPQMPRATMETPTPTQTMAQQPSLAGANAAMAETQPQGDVTPNSTKELENVLER